MQDTWLNIEQVNCSEYCFGIMDSVTRSYLFFLVWNGKKILLTSFVIILKYSLVQKNVMNILLQGLRTLRAPWSTFKKYNISYLPNWNIIFSTTDSSIEYILAAGWVSSTEQQPNDSHTQTQFPRIFYEKSSYEPSPFALRGTNLLPSFFTFLTFVFFQLEEGVMAVSVWKKF